MNGANKPTGSEAVAELYALAGAQCDGALTPAQTARLEEIVLGDKRLRWRYILYMQLHAVIESRETKAKVHLPSRFETSDHQQRLTPPLILDMSSTRADFPAAGPFSLGPLLNWACVVLIVGIALMIGWECKLTIDRMVADNAPRQAPATAGVPLAEPPKTQAPGVAQITGMVDCRWAEEEGEKGEGREEREGGGRKAEGGLLSSLPSPLSSLPSLNERVPLGRKYVLAAGLMEIAYDSGAKVILQGPCTYEVDSATGGFLSLGKLTARAEKKADGGKGDSPHLCEAPEGPSRQMGTVPFSASPSSALPPPPSPLFSIRTPIALVTDLGTEFGVEVDSSGVTGSHVFRGRVQMRSTIDVDNLPSPSGRGAGGEGDGRVVELKASESGRVGWDENGQVSVTRETAQVSTFVRELPRSAAVPAALSGQDARAPTSPVRPQPSPFRPVYRLTDLGDGATGQYVAINSVGQVVGEVKTSQGTVHAFLYTGGKLEDLGAPHGDNSRAFSINSAGQAVGYSWGGKGRIVSFLYSDGVMKNLPKLDSRTVGAYAINDGGEIVGAREKNGVGRAFLYTPGKGMTDLGALGNVKAYSRALAVNNASQVVGYSETASHTMHAFFYSSATGMNDLGTLGGGGSWAYAINDAGQVVGFSGIGGGKTDHAFLYSETTGMQDLGTLGGASSFAMSINNRGQVAGFSEIVNSSATKIHPFLYTDGKMIDLAPLVDVPDWTELCPTALNDAGQIAGYGRAPDRTPHFFLLTPERKQEPGKTPD